MSDALWTQQEAADYLRVSVRFLRNSPCPKVLLPGNGDTGKSLVRYDPNEVRAWADSRSLYRARRAYGRTG